MTKQKKQKGGPVITKKDLIGQASKSWDDLPIVQDPIHYAKEMYRMSRDTSRYDMGPTGFPTTPEAIAQYPELQGLDIVPKSYRPFTDKTSGVEGVWPVYSGEQLGIENARRQAATSPFRNPEEMSLGGVLGDTAGMAGIGSTFGPVGTAIGAGVGLVKGLFGHFKEKKDENAAETAEHVAWANNAQNFQQGYNPYTATLEFGGMAPGMNPNVELEKEETFQSPNGAVGQVDAPTHEQGGIEMNLEPGTRVWSDELKDPETGKTFAELSAPIMKQIAKYEKMLK